MTSFERIAPRLAGAALVTMLGLAATAGTAGADKPTRSCPPSFSRVSQLEMSARFGHEPGFEALFTSIDKNGDGLLCGKSVPAMFNTVDNVANTGETPTEQARPSS